MVGNLLLCFSFLSMLQLSPTGGACIIERLPEPVEDNHPGIWRLSLAHLLLRLPGFERTSVLHGLFGSGALSQQSCSC